MRETSRKLEQLNALLKLSSLINSVLDTSEIRKYAIEAAMSLLNTEAGSLILVDQETGNLYFEVALGDKGEKIKEVILKKGQGLAGWVVERREAIIVHNVQSDQRFCEIADMKSTFSTRDMVCVPVTSKDHVLGVLQAINKKNGIFDDNDKKVLMSLADQVAIAVENANLYQELKDTFYGTAKALAETIEKRDPYTGGHVKRVTQYSLVIGKALGFPKKDLEDLRLAATLHDIGKIGIRDDVLLKAGRLDDREFKKMIKHTEYGAEILGPVKQLRKIIPGVRNHHERVDGQGYPDNLKDTQIPLIAKIIAVADTFDAMTTDRPYRKALSSENAFEELKKNAGIQFDKVIVDTFINEMS
jgi:HD-GYP domain-containing protein (c-di-GMP phosphodiesterase class II)